MDENLKALKVAEAWLDRWAVHVGQCRGDIDKAACTCGLTRVQYDISVALSEEQ